jgi:ABC-2 type transport system ATP-binding protein
LSTLLEIRNLTKRYGPITAVDDLTFKVDRGEVLGFLGPNGAGKSTTMKIVTGYVPATSGFASVAGFDVSKDPIEVKRRIGYLPEGAPLYGDMTPASLLDFVCDVRGLSRAQRKHGIDYASEWLHIGSVMQQPIETLSKGYKRRVGLAQAIVHDPEVLILDEPTDGLDPNQKHEVRQLLQEMAGEKAIIISTHILEEVDAVCSRAIIIAHGRLVADSVPAQLQTLSALHNAVGIRVASGQAARVEQKLQAVTGVISISTINTQGSVTELLAVAQGGHTILGPVRDAVAAPEFGVEEIFVERGRLEDVFRQLTLGTKPGADHTGGPAGA